ncbi:hypothetical protein ACTPEU_20230, partial [Clostridioides difficile]
DIRTVFKLNSANFDIKFGEGYIDFVVKGYGHGVGMSQWGAEGTSTSTGPFLPEFATLKASFIVGTNSLVFLTK